MNKEKEEQIAEFWKQNQVYDKLREKLGKAKPFYFLDGPPYATGAIHVGTAYNKIIKDVYIRFWRMFGFNVWDQPGYDTHGLPIEIQVEKQLQIRSKSDIERIGIARFIDECRNFATKYIDIMSSQFHDLGVWMDWKNPYLTLANEYIEGAWSTFKIAYQKNLLYSGLYPVHVCPHCVDPNSSILVEGGNRKIKELKNCWKHNKVISFDTNSKNLEISNPLGYIENEGEDSFVLETKTNKRIIAASDHPFWTKNGWVSLFMLKLKDNVAIYNHVDSPLPLITEKGRILLDENDIKVTIKNMEITKNRNGIQSLNDVSSNSRVFIRDMVHRLRKQGYSYTQIIKSVKTRTKLKISKSWVAKVLKTEPKTRYEFLISDLKTKGIIPLFSKNTKTFTLARLLGHIFGDGSLIIKNSKNRKFPTFTMVFTGNEKDLNHIKKDLKFLGYRSTLISRTKSISIVNGRPIKGFTTSMRCYSSSLAVLLLSLGAPFGRKSEKNTFVPNWIKANRKISREFLAAYFGSELDIIKPRKYGKGFECLRLQLTKDSKYEKNGLEFAEKLCLLIKKFGVTTRKIKVARIVVNGKKKSKITISIDCNDDNLIKFTRFLGYEYCKKREIRASHVMGYLLFKKQFEKKQQKLKSKILTLRKTGISCKDISTKLDIDELSVRHVVYGRVKNIRAARYIPTFNNWLDTFSKGLYDGLVWDEIEKINYIGKRKVCDIAVETHHNFITNGFLTHNCETAVAYNEIEYAKVSDPSIYVKFPVKDNRKATEGSQTVPTFLVIWTTTPWTLPANTGIMAHPDAEYVKVKTDDQILILAKDLLETVMEKLDCKDYKTIEVVKGKQLKDMKYEHPLADIFTFQRELKNAHRVVLSDQFVTLEDGTGLVHSAPGHGQEDYRVGKETGLPVVSPVELNGTFNDECGEYSGMFVKAADKKILEELSNRGLLLHEERVSHDYPHCWRCDSALLQISVPQWFFRVTDIRNKLLNENKKVNWFPGWAKQRFENWLENLGDWPISRQRYWGIPLPIWTCECGNTQVIGSRDELPEVPEDFHRPYIDKIKLPCKCGKQMNRIPDVLDVWFDSGVASWAALGYPKDKKLFNKMWPADLNIEGPDQIRGWWNSELITSVITFDKAPFKNVLFHGFTLDSHGIKMSKSRGNVITTDDVVNKYGRDVLRYYLLSSPSWDDFYFNWTEVEARAKSFIVIENTFNFVKTYVPVAGANKNLKIEDRWILSRLNSLIENCTGYFKTYSCHKAAQEIHNFIINDFSRWYIKLIRNRTWPAYEGKDKEAAFYTLLEVVSKVSRLIAPLCPFLAEHAYKIAGKEGSVHLSNWPAADKKIIDNKLEKDMETAKKVVEAASSLRKENRVKLRWPLQSLAVNKQLKGMEGLLSEICNVKKVKFVTKGESGLKVKEIDNIKVYLDTEITDELRKEALVREVIRKVQDIRKKDRYVVSDKIVLFINTDELKQFEKQIKKAVGAAEISYEMPEKGSELIFDDKKIEICIKKV